MTKSPHKFQVSTSYKSIRTPNLDVLKRQIEQFRIQSKYDVKKQFRQEINYRNTQDLQKRVQIVLKQNSNLLAENADLSELLAQRTAEIQLLQTKLMIQTGPSPFMGNETLIQQFQLRQQKHIIQIKSLLEEIDILNHNYGTLQHIKRVQIQGIKSQYNRQAFNQAASLKRSQISNAEIYELQIRRLKDQIQSHKKKYNETLIHHKKQVVGYTEQIQRLKTDIRNIKNLKQLQLQQSKRQNQQKLSNVRKQISSFQQHQDSSINYNLRKTKRQLADKTAQNTKITQQITYLKQQNQINQLEMNQQKNRLRLQNQISQQKFKEEFGKLKTRLQGAYEKQIQILSQMNKQLISSLNLEISKLNDINQYKISEIKVLRQKQILEKQNYSIFSTNLKKQNNELRDKLNEVELLHKTQVQTLKIKITQLHYSQVDHLQKYIKNQISVLTDQIVTQEKIIEQNRNKLHIQIHNKDDLRKYYEIELSKQKAKVIDLKVKLASASVEMKEQMVSLASKLQLTSQTLIRQADLKKKQQVFSDQQRRKLHILINSKDKQIFLLNQQLNEIKKQHILQITNIEAYIREIKAINDQSNFNKKKDQQFYENQIKKKETIYKNQIEQLKIELSNSRQIQYEKIKQEIQILQKQNIRLVKELEKQTRQHQSKHNQLNLQRGFVQSMQLQSSAALEDEKNKYRVLVNQNQITLKEFFEQKTAHKNKEIKNLEQQLRQKQIDLRDIIAKYKDLERKLALAFQSIDKLSDLQNRVLNLGMDNNLVKNLSELFKGKTQMN